MTPADPPADPIVARDRHLRSAILGVIVLYAVTLLTFTDRPRLIGSRAMILPGSSIATTSAPSGYADALDQYGVHMAKPGRAPGGPQAAPLATPDRLCFGYSIVETSILGAPYWFRKDDGYVVYYETRREYVYAPVSDAYMRKVKLPGPTPLSSQRVGWWQHVWGWVFPLALAGWGWFEIGAARRKREAEGII